MLLFKTVAGHRFYDRRHPPMLVQDPCRYEVISAKDFSVLGLSGFDAVQVL
jgi:hypothetical protein